MHIEPFFRPHKNDLGLTKFTCAILEKTQPKAPEPEIPATYLDRPSTNVIPLKPEK